MSHDDVMLSRSATRRAVVATGAKVAYAAPLVAATMTLGAMDAAAQVSPAGPCTRLGTAMSGAQESTPSGSPATGSASLIVDPATGAIHYEVGFQNLLSPTISAHVHRAPAGIDGPVVLPITNLPLGVTSGSASGDAADPVLAAELAANPGGFYVNVHTDLFPGGEIRGQLGCA